jgi:hypothetical protein
VRCGIFDLISGWQRQLSYNVSAIRKFSQCAVSPWKRVRARKVDPPAFAVSSSSLVFQPLM